MVGFRKYKKLRDEITMMQESITETNLKLEKFVETWGRSFFEYDKKNSTHLQVMQETIDALTKDMKHVKSIGFFDAQKKQKEAKDIKIVDEWLLGDQKVKANG